MSKLLPILLITILATPVLAQEINYEFEFAEIDRQIYEAEKEAAKYSSGLILIMIKLRVELLKSSKAFIEMRRQQDALHKLEEPDVVRRRFSSSQLTSDLLERKAKGIGLLCGDSDLSHFPIVLNQKEKQLSFLEFPSTPYTETKEDILFNQKIDEHTGKCRLNRYTLELTCTEPKKAAKDFVTKCKWAGTAKIPSNGQYWLSCGVRGKPKTERAFRISVGSNSTIKGGYLVWKNVPNKEVAPEECKINRVNGRIGCKEAETATGKSLASDGWSILNKPECRVLPRRFQDKHLFIV